MSLNFIHTQIESNTNLWFGVTDIAITLSPLWVVLKTIGLRTIWKDERNPSDLSFEVNFFAANFEVTIWKTIS